jgi:DeoR/GlpR family transcriptional regulator of sugar metabolism
MHGFTGVSLVEAEVKASLTGSAGRAVALADRARFGDLTFTTIVQFQSIKTLINYVEPDTATTKRLLQQGTRLLIAQKTRW